MTPTQRDRNRIVYTIEQVAKKKNQKNAVHKLREYFRYNKLTAGLKDTVIDQLNNIIKGEMELEMSTVFMSLMGYRRPEIVFTDYQKRCLKDIREIVKNTWVKECRHKLVVVPFLHGGGFCPIHILPELICHICGLNITLPVHKSQKELLEQYGIDMPTKLKGTLKYWCKWVDADKDTRVFSSREITKDLESAMEKSTQFYGDLSTLKIADKKKFESWSGK